MRRGGAIDIRADLDGDGHSEGADRLADGVARFVVTRLMEAWFVRQVQLRVRTDARAARIENERHVVPAPGCGVADDGAAHETDSSLPRR